MGQLEASVVFMLSDRLFVVSDRPDISVLFLVEFVPALAYVICPLFGYPFPLSFGTTDPSLSLLMTNFVPITVRIRLLLPVI